MKYVNNVTDFITEHNVIILLRTDCLLQQHLFTGGSLSLAKMYGYLQKPDQNKGRNHIGRKKDSTQSQQNLTVTKQTNH